MNDEPVSSALESLGKVLTIFSTSSHGLVRSPRVGSEMSKNENVHQVTRSWRASKNIRDLLARSGYRDGGIVKAATRG